MRRLLVLLLLVVVVVASMALTGTPCADAASESTECGTAAAKRLKIGILGRGDVARVLATAWAAQGHEVMVGSRNATLPTTLATAAVKTGSYGDAAAFGDVVVLAVFGQAARDVLLSVEPHVRGKTVLDTTNPIKTPSREKAPRDGVFEYFTPPDTSLMEILQAAVPSARLVKAFNSMGSSVMARRLPTTQTKGEGGLRVQPTMFIAGDDADAKRQATDLVAELGWRAFDLGGAHAALAIESLCQLWVAVGLRRGTWDHLVDLVVPSPESP